MTALAVLFLIVDNAQLLPQIVATWVQTHDLWVPSPALYPIHHGAEHRQERIVYSVSFFKFNTPKTGPFKNMVLVASALCFLRKLFAFMFHAYIVEMKFKSINQYMYNVLLD